MKTNFNTGVVLLRREQCKSNDKKPRWQRCQELKDLEKLSLEVKRLRYPNNPYLVGDQFEDRTSNGLTKAIISFLRLRGHHVERVANMGRPVDHRQTFQDVTGKTRQIGSLTWLPGSGTNGSSDLHCCIGSRAVYLEIKIGNDRQSLAQKNYEKQVVSSFGVYHLCRTFESFVQWYEEMFKL